MGIDSHLSTCVCTQSPKYLEMAQGHISLSKGPKLEEGGEDLKGVPIKREVTHKLVHGRASCDFGHLKNHITRE
jgi:hypothetical protein